MRPSRVKQKWAEGKPAFCTAVSLTDPCVSELVSVMGFDCIWIDMEHHAVSLETAAQMMRAARVGVSDIMARPAKGEFMRMGRMLEAGCQGILYPRCEDAAEAAEVVRWTRFAPLGERGLDGGNPDNSYGLVDNAQYIKEANQQTFVAVQIESPSAVNQARAIAEIEGVDLIFFGPGDFSVLSGVPVQTGHEKVLSATEQVCRAALAGRKRFGTLCFGVAHAQRLLDMGASFLAFAADLSLLRRAYQCMQEEFKPLGFVFSDGRLEHQPTMR